MALEDSILALRLRVMTRAQELHNVTRACPEFGVSRTLFYRWQKRYLAYGRDGLHSRQLGPRRGRPPLRRVKPEPECWQASDEPYWRAATSGSMGGFAIVGIPASMRVSARLTHESSLCFLASWKGSCRVI